MTDAELDSMRRYIYADRANANGRLTTAPEYPRRAAETQEAQATMQATPHKQLIEELLNSNVPKNEREHAAAREIEKLLEENKRLNEQLKTCATRLTEELIRGRSES